MEKEKSLHELYDDFADDVNIEALVILSLYVTVNVHVQHLSHNALFRMRNTMWPLN